MANDIDGQRLVDDDEYVRLFRMGRGTFDWLKSQLEPHIGTRELCAGQRLALALRYLASGASMRVVAADMGRGHATVHEAVHEVCAAIVNELHGMIHMPTTVEELTLSASAFMTAGDGLPQCFAAVDGTHVAVKDLGLRALYNRKGFCSFNVQAVCNGEGLWIAVEVGNAGSMHDARAFSESSLGRGLQGVVGQFLWSARMPVQGTAMPMSILADSAYACSTFVLPAYKDNVANRCPNKARYNTLHSRARSKVERAFGRLKMRWRVLLRENDVTLPYVSTMIMACFILHNIVEVRAEPPPVEDEELVALMQAYNAMFQDVVQEHEADEGDEEVVRGLMLPGTFGTVHPPPLLGRRAHGVAVREAVVQQLAV
ncbi:hypothetical protein QJQ45_013208 [Haematococcus lacustris]|nr:hypothetical protein QJQ45_013208 [Haematococcus lacustris]